MVVEEVLGPLPVDWTYTTLGVACARAGGDIQTGPFGSQLHAADYVPSGVPSIMPQNIGDNSVNVEGIARISLADATRLSRYLVRAGDIVYSRRGDVERRALVREKEDGWLCGTGCLRVRFGDSLVDPEYASYYLGHPKVRGWIVRHAHGATMPNLNTSILSDCPFVLPPQGDQKAIARILGAYDAKIELNRRMNETLEAMARALFKSWFVDFDPVRAKAEGRDPSLPQPIADLFPDGFEDAVWREIPVGWRTARLGEVLSELVSGARPPGGAVTVGVPSIGAENVLGLGRYDYSKEKFVPHLFFDELRRKGAAVRPGDVLLYKDGAHVGRKTYFDHGFPHEQCAVNEHAFIVRASWSEGQRFLFFWLDQDRVTNQIIALNSNSAQPGINQAGVRSLPVLVPPTAVITAFDTLVRPLTDRLFANCHESRTLARMREALLPKLISGEVRVQQVERFLEATSA